MDQLHIDRDRVYTRWTGRRDQVGRSWVDQFEDNIPVIAAGPAQYINQVIGPKATLPVICAGTQFYFTAASGPLFVKPPAGSWTLYYSSMGDTVGTPFNLLTLYNPTANAVTFGLIVSFTDIIDKRQLSSTQTPNVGNIVPQTSSGGGYLATAFDLSGTQFSDSAGTPWLAIQRASLNVAILGYAGSSGLVFVWAGLKIVNLCSIAGNTTDIPQPPIVVINSSGLFSVTTSMDPATWTVFEIYQALAPNSQAYQPPN